MELQLKDVTKKYGEKVALDRFSYTFRPAGKSPSTARTSESWASNSGVFWAT